MTRDADQTNGTIRLTVDSQLANVPLLGVATNRICSHIGLGTVVSYRIELCVVEAVTNCIVHAYAEEPGHEVEVTLALEQDRIRFEIRDSGTAMQRQLTDIAPPTVDPADREGLPEGGMGLFIMKEVMDSVEYRSQDGENVLTMVKLLEPIMAYGGSEYDED